MFTNDHRLKRVNRKEFFMKIALTALASTLLIAGSAIAQEVPPPPADQTVPAQPAEPAPPPSEEPTTTPEDAQKPADKDQAPAEEPAEEPTEEEAAPPVT